MLPRTIQVNWVWVASLILLLALSRFIPHPPNFTPVGAMAILAGAAVKDLRLGILIPIAAMLVSDVLIGFHSSLPFVYGAVTVMVLISRYLLSVYSMLRLLGVTLVASVVFFIITNFGAWLSHDMYPHTMQGLWQAYVAGIPFFRNTLLSNLLFTAIGFYLLAFVPASKAAQIQ